MTGSLTARIVLGCALTLACSAPANQETLGAEPSQVDFDAVVKSFGYACGSLDCHGSATRNFRLYSRPGLRLAADDIACGSAATSAELLADYRSAVGLEPELTSAVFESGGQHPERLTLVRKARGSESHTGGAVFPQGSRGDLCLVSWLQGQVDVASCNDTHIMGVRCIGD
jgi:hypothetical protein